MEEPRTSTTGFAWSKGTTLSDADPSDIGDPVNREVSEYAHLLAQEVIRGTKLTPDDGKDLAQDFLGNFFTLPTPMREKLQNPSDYAARANRALKNRMFTKLRQNKKFFRMDQGDEESESDAIPTDGTPQDRELEAREFWAWFDRTRAKLTARQLEVWNRIMEDEQTHAEAGDDMGTAAATVSSHISAALRKLRAAWQQYEETCS